MMNAAKKFNHQSFPFELYKPCVRIDNSENSETGRLYKTIEGNIYPSITSILAIQEKPELENWRRVVGETESNRVSLRATTNGTYIHNFAEDYVNNKINDRYKINPMVMAKFEPFKIALDKHVDNIFHTELKMYSDKLRVAGTTDLIAEYDGVLSIIDYKTSNRVKETQDIKDYFIQASVYAAMVFEIFSLTIKDIVIIMGVDGDKEPLLFREKVKDHLKDYFPIRKRYKAKFNV